MMRHQIFDSFAGFDDFLVYLAISLVLLYVFVWLYIRVTPWAEMALIRAGNMAAAFSLSGAILGFIVPLSAAIKYSVNLVDMVIWGVIALVVQIAAFVVVKLLVPSVSQDIEAGNGAQGFFLGVTSLAAGLLNAACMSY
jgi:putative membrane protein